MEDIIKLISESFDLVDSDCFGFDSLKVGPMSFKIKHWTSNILGNVSHMNAKAPFGLMTMQSVIINPSKIDMPLLSLDVVKVMGKYSIFCELYDTTLEGFDQTLFSNIKGSLSKYEDIPQKENWYDSIKMDCCMYKKCSKSQFKEIKPEIIEYVAQYCDRAKQKERFSDPTLLEQKAKKNDCYVDGLLNNGGPSTSIFLKSIGKERTSELFHKVLF